MLTTEASGVDVARAQGLMAAAGSARRGARRRVRAGEERAGIEALEGRTLLSTVMWDGGPSGTGTDFNQAVNWVGDVLPGAADDAVINSAGPAITLGAAASVATLTSARAMTIGSGGNLTTTGTNSLSAPVTLQSGTVTGGAWVFSGAGNAFLGSNLGGTLNNVSVTGDVLLATTSASVVLRGTTTFTAARLSANATIVSLSPGYVLNSPVIAEGVAIGTRVVSMAVGAGTATIGASGSISIAAGCGGDLSIQNTFAMTLVNNGTITNGAAGQTLTIQCSAFTNNSQMSVSGGTLSIAAPNWSSGGAIGGTGATIAFGGTWSLTGPLSIDNTTLNLGGTFTTAAINLAGFTRVNGGQVNITGTMNNASATLLLNAASGSWRMAGGTVNDGAITYANGEALIATNQGGTLNNVAVGGDLTLNTTSANMTVRGSTTFVTARLGANATNLFLSPGYVLSNAIVAEGAAAGTRVVSMGVGTGTVTVGASGSISIAGGCGGDLSVQNNFAWTLINNGTISNGAAARTLTIQCSAFTNNAPISTSGGGSLAIASQAFTNGAALTQSGGTLSITATNWSSSAAISGTGATVTFGGTWSLTGPLSIDNTTLNLGGTFTTAAINLPAFTRINGGQVNVTGTMNNASATLPLNAANGSWRMAGGTINGGAITFTNGQTLSGSNLGGTLNNVEVGGDLVLDVTSANMTVQGTTTFGTAHLAANATSLRFSPGYVLNSAVVAEGPTAGARSISMDIGSGTATIGPSGSIILSAGCGGDLSLQNNFTLTLVNNGTIANNAIGRTLTIQNSTFTNAGAMSVTAGTMSIRATNWSSSGSMSAAGAMLTLAGTWSNTGTLSIDNATLNLDGTFTTAGINVPGFTRLNGGQVNIAGTMNNASATLPLSAGTGTWRLLGGVISGGTITYAGGAALAPTNFGGTLNNVAVMGDLTLDTTSANVTVQGTTSFGTAHLAANATSLRLSPGYVLSSAVVAEGAAAGTRSVSMDIGTGTATIGPSGSIILAAGCGGDLSLQNNFALTLVNNGLIAAGAAGRTLTIQNSTFTNNGTVRASAGTLAIATATTNLTNFNAGTLAGGTWEVIGAATLNLNAARAVATNAATILLDGAGSVCAQLSGLTTNNGSLTLANGRAFDFVPAGNTFVNVGTFAKTGTGSTTVGAAVTFNNPGSVTVSGGTLTLSGPVTQAAGSTLSGGTWTVVDPGTLVISGASFTTIGGANVTLSGPASTFAMVNPVVTNNGVFTVTEGRAFSVAGTFANTGLLNVGAGSVFSVSGATNNSGAMNVTGGRYAAGGAFNQAASGVVSVSGSGELDATGGGASSGDISLGNGSVVFNGTHTLAAGADISGVGSLTVQGGSFTDAGVVNIMGNAIFNGGSASFGDAFAAGSVTIGAATAAFNGLTTLTNLTLNGGTLAGSGAISVSGVFDWESGTMQGAGATSVSAGGTLTLASAGSKTLSRVLNNAGAAAWSGGDIAMSGGTLNNQVGGTFAATVAAAMTSGGGTNAFNNTGTLTRNGTGTATIGVPFNNNGQVNVQTGTLALTAGGTHNGDLAVSSGTGVTLGGTHSFGAGADVSGAGSATVSGGASTFGGAMTVAAVMVGGGTATFNGTLAVGGMVIQAAGTAALGVNGSSGPVVNTGRLDLGAHTLNVAGGYSQIGAGVLAVRMNGTGAGQFGRLAATGSVTLSGGLEVTWAFTPPAAVHFDFVSGSSRSGTFSSVSIQPLSNGAAVSVQYTATGVRLVLAARKQAVG